MDGQFYRAEAQPDASDQTWRRTGIGGSDSAAILGLTPYGTRYGVAVEKIYGVRENDDETSRERREWGRRIEPLVRAGFAEKTGLTVLAGSAFVRMPGRAHVFGNVDGLIDSLAGATLLVPRELEGPGVFEAKCTAGPDTDAWGTDADPLVPIQYWVQGQHYLAVTGRAWVGYGCLQNGNRLITRWTLRDDDWIADVLLPALDDFWADVQAGRTGDPVSAALDMPVLKALYPQDDGSRVELTREQTAIVYRWAAAADARLAAEKAESALKVQVAAMLGAAKVGVLTTGEVITYSTNSAGVRSLAKPKAEKPKRGGR